MKSKESRPFDKEWEKELMKWNKIHLIDMVRKNQIERDKFRGVADEMTKALEMLTNQFDKVEKLYTSDKEALKLAYSALQKFNELKN